jgi:16S rRNA (guanine527-N7)-methyltransferase
MDLSPLTPILEAQGATLSPEQLDQLAGYLSALYETNAHTNLTRIPMEEAVIKHLGDALLLLRFLPSCGSVMDLGTGPGVPAWPLACLRPDLTIHALDATAKVHRFLQSVPLQNLILREQRAEDVTRREGFDAVTGRALAPFAIQAELSAAWVKVGGIFVPFRTPIEREEIAETNIGVLGLKLEDFVEVPLVGTDVVRLFPIFRKMRETPETYPRTWARIKAKPLGKKGS